MSIGSPTDWRYDQLVYITPNKEQIRERWPEQVSRGKARCGARGLPEPNVETHHHHEPDDAAPRCQLAVASVENRLLLHHCQTKIKIRQVTHYPRWSAEVSYSWKYRYFTIAFFNSNT